MRTLLLMTLAMSLLLALGLLARAQAAPLTGVTLSASPASPQPAPAQVTLTAHPVGGATVEYRFTAVSPAGNASTLRDYATATTCVWSPQVAGAYTVQVYAREVGGTQDPAITCTLHYTLQVSGTPYAALNISAAPTPGVVNQPTTLTAVATGGTNPVYQFWLGDPAGAVWTVVQDYGPQNTCVWTPTTAGTFPLIVRVREAGATKAYELQSATTYQVVGMNGGGPGATIALALSAVPASPQPVNLPIALTAQSTLPAALSYQFTVTPDGGTPTVLRDYAGSPNCTWTPTQAGKYTLTVLAREAGNTGNPYQASLAYSVTPRSPIEFYVSPSGQDNWSGTLPAANATGTDGPFATLEAARNALRVVKQAGMPAGGATVWLRGGVYARTATFTLSSQDSGTADAPIVYQAYAGETVRLTGGQSVTGWGPVADPAILARLPAAARARVVQADLRGQGLTDFGSLGPAGSVYPPQDRGFELFCQDQPMTLARWPNVGSWATVAGVPDGQNGATITYTGDEPAQWTHVEDIWLHGFWTWDWADTYVNVASIDTARRNITMNPPFDPYGFSVGGRFYAENILEELDAPGEYYLDRQSGILYFWPPAPGATAQTTISVLSDPLVNLQQTSYVTLRGLTCECTRGMGIVMAGGAHNLVADSTLRNFGNYAVNIDGGSYHGVQNCVISGTGDGGIILNGTSCYATNNEIAHYSRVVFCYQAGIHVAGMGNLVAHNKIYDAPHNAILIDGRNETVEFNDISQVVLQTQDSGAVYTGGEGPNTVRYNFIHDLGKGALNSTQTPFTAAIYDDAGGGNLTVFGNVLVNGYIGILFTGGSNNTIRNNVVTGFTDDCWFDASGGYPQGNLIDTNVFNDNGPRFMNGADQTGNAVANNLIGVNPQFTNPAGGNYQLPTTSPAYTQITGFQAIPFDEIGRQ